MKPFFSIVIPTYNRADMLYFALKSYLQQDFSDFEIVVTDNNSTDNTKAVVEGFNDKRIKYYKNTTNIGFINNIQQGVLKAIGNYVITHGDDDVLLYKNSLKKIHTLLVRRNVGFVRINCLSQSRTNARITHVWIDKKRDWYLKPNSDSLDIINFFDKVNLPFISGLVFKNENITSEDFANSELSPWFGCVFKQVKKYGGYFLKKTFIVASWSKGGIGSIYFVNKSEQLFFYAYLEYLCQNILTKSEFEKYKSKYSKAIRAASIFLLPTIKYFTNNKNLIKYESALSKFDRNITTNFTFRFFYYLSLVLPKSIISIIRNNIHYFRRDTALILSDIAGKDEINTIENSYQRIMNSKINL